MIAKINSSLIMGIEGISLDVEVDIARGLPVFSTVGLPDNAVRESKDRVKAAIKNSGYDFPNKRITINIAPAHLKKEGSSYDLPIAIGILTANGLIQSGLVEKYCIVGELSLDGKVRSVNGVLPMAISAREAGMQGIIVPKNNVEEASLISGLEIIGVITLGQTVQFLAGDNSIGSTVFDTKNRENHGRQKNDYDFSDVAGQEHVKRALEIAASGNHNILTLNII